MSNNAIIHAYHYKQLTDYIAKVIEAFYMQNIKVFEAILDSLSTLVEALDYSSNFNYTLRDNSIAEFKIRVSKADYVLIDFKSLDRVSYIAKKLETAQIKNAKSTGQIPPKKKVEYTFTGGRQENVG